MTGFQVRGFIQFLRNEKHLTESTISLYLAGMSSFYNELVLLGAMNRLVGNPFRPPFTTLPRGSKKPKTPTQALTREEVALMLFLPDKETTIGVRDYCILSLLFGAGLRLGELLSLSFKDVIEDYAFTKIRLYNTKTASFEEISLAPWVAKSISEWQKVSGLPVDSPVIPLGRTTVQGVFKRYLRQANIYGRYSPRSARATAITELLKMGFPHWEVQAFSRHSSPWMVARYDKRRRSLSDNPGLKLNYSPSLVKSKEDL